MAVRSTMASLIARARGLINDPAGASQIFSDQDIQNVFDECRIDLFNEPLETKPTYTSGSIQWLFYWHPLTNFEDGMVLKQYLVTTVVPSAIDPINGIFTFAANTFPPVYLTGSTHDIWRTAADLLERMAVRWTGFNGYDFASDGQSFRISQASTGYLALARSYRVKQRAVPISMQRSDITDQVEAPSGNVIADNPIHRMAPG